MSGVVGDHVTHSMRPAHRWCPVRADCCAELWGREVTCSKRCLLKNNQESLPDGATGMLEKPWGAVEVTEKTELAPGGQHRAGSSRRGEP